MPFVGAIVTSADPNVTLRDTAGGPPHITIIWAPAGKISKFELGRLRTATDNILNGRILKVVDAKINSFTKESAGKVRHDVLLHFSAQAQEQVEKCRQVILSDAHREFGVTHIPHVTYCTEYDRNQAQKHLQYIQALLPFDVKITGTN